MMRNLSSAMMRLVLGAGCLAIPGMSQTTDPPTYSKEVSRIMQAKCQLCHRPNDIAPFALMSYDDAQTWSDDIKRVITEGIMPPWKPVAGHGEFKGSYALTAAEKKTILDWVDAGAPEGDPADLPGSTVSTGDWRLGTPDLTLTMAEEFIPVRGRDIYRCFVLPVASDRDLWVKGLDILPGNRQVVHHVILYIDQTGKSKALDDKEDGPGYTCFGGPGFDVGPGDMLGGWAPGAQPQIAPQGVGGKIPAGSRVVMQVHYSTFGKATAPDVTRAGIYLWNDRPERQLYFVPVLNQRFEIPVGADNYEVKASFPVLPVLSAKIISIFPHMHLLGKQISVDLDLPNKTTQPLIYIDNWDFNWQGGYQYVNPVSVPGFSTVRVSCKFDNSENNPKNPNNPLVPVRWGEETKDEMCLAFLAVTLDNPGIIIPSDAGVNK